MYRMGLAALLDRVPVLTSTVAKLEETGLVLGTTIESLRKET